MNLAQWLGHFVHFLEVGGSIPNFYICFTKQKIDKLQTYISRSGVVIQQIQVLSMVKFTKLGLVTDMIMNLICSYSSSKYALFYYASHKLRVKALKGVRRAPHSCLTISICRYYSQVHQHILINCTTNQLIYLNNCIVE